MGCVAIVALLRGLAAAHNTPEQGMAVNAMCHTWDMSSEMKLWKMWCKKNIHVKCGTKDLFNPLTPLLQF